MTLFEIPPVLAYVATIAFVLLRALSPDRLMQPGAWRFPAILSVLFTAFTLYQISADGILMFWTNHTVNANGNQVWFDLLLSVSMAFALMVPAARQQGIRLLPWAVFVLATASIGLLAMIARLTYLQETSSQPQVA